MTATWIPNRPFGAGLDAEDGPPCPHVHGLRRFSLAICTPVLHVIERIVAPLGLRVDATSPWVDARLPDGSRVQTNFLSTLFLRLLGHPVQPPALWHALQFVLAGVLEDEPGAGGQILHRRAGEDLR